VSGPLTELFFFVTVLSPFYSRDDKRYTEKKNKSERARRKKEDIAKMRNLVDMAQRSYEIGYKMS
jgi:transaldolase